jgi:hypothetical protein
VKSTKECLHPLGGHLYSTCPRLLRQLSSPPSPRCLRCLQPDSSQSLLGGHPSFSTAYCAWDFFRQASIPSSPAGTPTCHHLPFADFYLVSSRAWYLLARPPTSLFLSLLLLFLFIFCFRCMYLLSSSLTICLDVFHAGLLQLQ